MTTFRISVACFCASAMLPAEPVAAQNSTELLARADANSDGAVSASESAANRKQIFSKLDRNGDGVVNESDRPAFAGRGRFDEAFAMISKGADSNRDGAITWAEFDGAQQARFKRLDRNKDGMLDASELAQPGM